MTFQIILGILLADILSNNYALIHFLGTGAVIENERSTPKSVVLGLGTTLVMIITTALTYPLDKYVLAKYGFEHFQTLAFVIVILAVVEILHALASKLLDNYCRADFVKFAINGAILGVCVHNTGRDFGEALVTALAVGLGFMLTMVIFSKLKTDVIDEEAVPASFRGLPIDLLTAGMIVLAFLALTFNIG